MSPHSLCSRSSSDQSTLLSAAGSSGKDQPSLAIPAPKATKTWALAEADFAEGLVGGKSRNLATLREQLPATIAVGSPGMLRLSCTRVITRLAFTGQCMLSSVLK